jgi:cell division protein FtsB
MKRGSQHTHVCAVVSPNSGNPCTCDACGTFHSSKTLKSAAAPVAAWSYRDAQGQQLRPKATTKRLPNMVVLCESCLATRRRKAEKNTTKEIPPSREAAAAIEEDDESSFLRLLGSVGPLDNVFGDDIAETVGAADPLCDQAAAAATRTPAARTCTPEPPSSEKHAPSSEARRGLQLEARIAELTSENVGLHATITELKSENVGLNATNSELTAENSELTRENVGLNATIVKLQGQLTSTGTASDAELEKRLEEYEKTTHGISSSSSLSLQL